ncbi:hypothetical protein [Bacillus sp. PS06]|uniref:hypothetical protein n=1 Tax=Bacillus sp. PS06 TaxID=2764176 RepID=UPI00177D80F3|nr:hypothetical protein [Bacillus sp. PS06]MBD8069467.1 hypothetical protein [Bacillus sp. PS06]
MIPFIIILLIAGVCLFLALKKKRPILLLLPFLTIFLYFVVEVILFPAPLLETIKFIFSLR